MGRGWAGKWSLWAKSTEVITPSVFASAEGKQSPQSHAELGVTRTKSSGGQGVEGGAGADGTELDAVAVGNQLPEAEASVQWKEMKLDYGGDF